MLLQDFIEAHPQITRRQLARIAGCSVDTVNRWFMVGATAVTPTEQHLQRLAIAHWLWTQEATEPDFFKQLRQIRAEMDSAD